MASDKRTVRPVKTLSQLLGRRRTRTAPGALPELSALANERRDLRRERERWEQSQREATARLAEIREREQALAAVVQILRNHPFPDRPGASDGRPGHRGASGSPG